MLIYRCRNVGGGKNIQRASVLKSVRRDGVSAVADSMEDGKAATSTEVTLQTWAPSRAY